ncbi:MAG: B12-binding domain-containing radical SAM protein [Nitrospina sp.]|nr:B12-binding domain-containing radical SAM protein [Nitrospina sp.]
MNNDLEIPSFEEVSGAGNSLSDDDTRSSSQGEHQTFIQNPTAIRKILLLFPPAYTLKNKRDINPLPPLGIGLLAAVAEKSGYEVKILDCLVQGWDQEEPSQSNQEIVRVGLSDEQIQAEVREFAPDVVGVSCMFSIQHKVYPRVFAAIKQANPSVITIGGGPHVTVCSEEVLADQNCDYTISGEGENSFIDFLDTLQGKRGFESVDGLGWKKSTGNTINPKVKWIEDLDSLPFPAYHLIGLEKYFGLEASHGIRHEERFAPIVTSRGCPAKCTFCSANKMFGYQFRTRTPKNIMKELWFLKKTYGVKEIMFEDDNVTANRKYAEELFNTMIEEKIDLKWDTPNGVGLWTLTEELLELMQKAGCVRINFPVESGDQEVLKNIIKKPLDLQRVKNLLKHCQKIKLDYGLFLVIGMPGEKISDIWTSFKFSAEAGCFSPHISIATPYPGTELYEQCKNEDYFSRDYSLSDLFISSFLINTPDWSETSLRKTLLMGKLYFKVQQLIHQPAEGFRTLLHYMGRPAFVFNYLKRILMPGSIWRNPAN